MFPVWFYWKIAPKKAVSIHYSNLIDIASLKRRGVETDDWAVVDLERLVIQVGRSMRQCRRLGVAFSSRGLGLVEGYDAKNLLDLSDCWTAAHETLPPKSSAPSAYRGIWTEAFSRGPFWGKNPPGNPVVLLGKDPGFPADRLERHAFAQVDVVALDPAHQPIADPLEKRPLFIRLLDLFP